MVYTDVGAALGIVGILYLIGGFINAGGIQFIFKVALAIVALCTIHYVGSQMGITQEGVGTTYGIFVVVMTIIGIPLVIRQGYLRWKNGELT